MDIARVVELYVPGSAGGGQIGSGYRLTEELVLTAGHVVADLPTHPADTAVPDSVDTAGLCQARPLGEHCWTAAAVAWRDGTADVAVLRLAGSAPPLPAASPTPRWGRVEGLDSVAVSAVGFPWAQERPDRVRDSEHLFGFLAPGTTVKTGQFAITVLTSPLGQRSGGSPWAGMSGAALFSGPFLIGVLIVDPGRFADRVVAAPLAPLLADPALVALPRMPASTVTVAEPQPRLAVTADISVSIAPPYSPAEEGLGQQQPARLLLPEYGIVPFLGRDQQLLTLQDWCMDERSWGLRLLLGVGGSGKTRLAAEACVRMTGHGWQAGFADPDAPGGVPVLEFNRATLLVIDDADLNVALLEKLVRRLAYWPPDAPPVRLLLLARHDQPWWGTLNQETDHLPEDHAAPPLTLAEGGLDPSERADQHVRALKAFARPLATPPLAEEMANRPAPDLDDAAFANPLLVHMHALLAASGAEAPTTGNAVRVRILDAVLDGERRRWKQTFPQSVLISHDVTRHQVVATATLLAPPDQPATTALLTVVEDLAEAGAVARRSVANWLHRRYPGAEPPWVAPLRPDLLTEQLLATCPQLTELDGMGAGAPATDDRGLPLRGGPWR